MEVFVFGLCQKRVRWPIVLVLQPGNRFNHQFQTHLGKEAGHRFANLLGVVGRQPVQGICKAGCEPMDGLRLGLQEPVGRRERTVGQVPVLGAQGCRHMPRAVVQQLFRCGLGHVDKLGLVLTECGYGFIQGQPGDQVQLLRLNAMPAQCELERGPGHGRESHGDQSGALQRLPSKWFLFGPAQDEEPVPGIDLGEVDRDRFRPPIGGDDGPHDAALSDVCCALVQGAHGMGELGRAGLEINVQTLFLQETTGHRNVDRSVEHGTEGLDEPQWQTVTDGRQVVSFNSAGGSAECGDRVDLCARGG